MASKKAPRNRTIGLSPREAAECSGRLLRLAVPCETDGILGRTICQDLFEVLPLLPPSFVDLLIVDPPYNLAKSFNGQAFRARSAEEYEQWLESWLAPMRRCLKSTATVYICGDWRSSSALQRVVERHFILRNRITWEREKGRGADANWKNCAEDIWYCTVSPRYTFRIDDVKLKRRVLAPYRGANGEPKDWEETGEGNFRVTHPSNVWTDISVPFWSMPENTRHPTQKPEKLIAKLVLASSQPNDVVLDPFLGSGTTSVVAKKLGRRFVGVEIDEDYCCLAEKRLALAEVDATIQGYRDGVFWERNSKSPTVRRAQLATSDNALFERELPS